MRRGWDRGRGGYTRIIRYFLICGSGSHGGDDSRMAGCVSSRGRERPHYLTGKRACARVGTANEEIQMKIEGRKVYARLAIGTVYYDTLNEALINASERDNSPDTNDKVVKIMVKLDTEPGVDNSEYLVLIRRVGGWSESPIVMTTNNSEL